MFQYGLIRQKEDNRDLKLPRLRALPVPRLVDLRSKCPPVFDQRELGSCTANAGVAARMMMGTTPELSRLFLYYQERALNGTISTDSGAEMRDICKTLNKYGVCEERYYPYDISKYKNRPTSQAYKNAQKYTIKSYATFDGDTDDDLQQIRQYLFNKQQPVLIGMDIYESFESKIVAKTGRLPMPNTKTEKLLGGHAVLIVGYSDANRVLIARNSWGPDWGDDGYFYLPYQYVGQKLAYDSWTMSM